MTPEEHSPDPDPPVSDDPAGLPHDAASLPDDAAGVPHDAAGLPDDAAGVPDDAAGALSALTRDIADVPAIEVITTCAVHLMSAAAVKLGLAEEGESYIDLDEARRLIEALAGLVDGSKGSLAFHAAPVRDGLRTLQLAFREASRYPDAPGEGPGERYTGPVY